MTRSIPPVRRLLMDAVLFNKAIKRAKEQRV